MKAKLFPIVILALVAVSYGVQSTQIPDQVSYVVVYKTDSPARIPRYEAEVCSSVNDATVFLTNANIPATRFVGLWKLKAGERIDLAASEEPVAEPTKRSHKWTPKP